MADWSTLPEELLNMIAVRLFSIVELKRFRSICKPWRSSVPGTGGINNPFQSRPLIHFNPITSNTSHRFKRAAVLSRAAFFRVTLSSSSSKGWLIKSDVDINSGRFRLLQPLSRLPLTHSLKSLDLLEFTFSEIQEAYAVLARANLSITAPSFRRSVLVKVKEGEDYQHGVLGISCVGNITYWTGQVLRILEKVAFFSDIINHNGETYALDSQGSLWFINSDLEISRKGPTLHEYHPNSFCGDMRLVECCGELLIVERLRNKNAGNVINGEPFDYFKTAGFKVYKIDDELGRLIEVKSLGDNTFIMATDKCFSVLAHEFYGCLQNSIYFIEDKEIKVFELGNDNGSVKTKLDLFPSCFEMFFPSFL